MAAHPFGPIENQLIVGYYKQHRHPGNIEPKFLFQDLLVPGPKAHPVYAMTNPNFYGWSPANGNSSSHDFRVTFDHSCGAPVNLLSRGLGYRITFTIGVILQVKIESLDLFGDRVFGSTVLDSPNLKANLSLLLHELKDYDSLELQVSIDQIKIRENGTIQHVVPNYDLRSRMTSTSVQEVMQKFRSLLETSPPAERTAFLLMSEMLLGICLHIRRSENPPTPAQMSVLKPHLLNCSSLLAKYCAEPTHQSEREIDWEPLALKMEAVHQKLKDWTESLSDFPSEELFLLVLKINGKLQAKLNKLGQKDRAAEEVTKKLTVRERYYYSQMWNVGLGPGSGWLWSLIDLSPDLTLLNEQNHPKAPVYHTENYEVQVSSAISYRKKGSSSDYSRIHIPITALPKSPNLKVWLVPDSDHLIVGAAKKPYKGLFWVDLSESGLQIINLNEFLHFKFTNEATEFEFLGMVVTPKGFHLLLQATKAFGGGTAVLTARFRPDNGTPLIHTLTCLDLGEGLKIKQLVKFGRMKITRNKSRLFLLIGREEADKQDEESSTLHAIAACYKVHPVTMKLTLEKSDRLTNKLKQRLDQTGKINSVWIENSHGRMFACIFPSSGSKLLLCCFHKGHFVPVGSRAKNQLGMFETAARFKYLFAIQDTASNNTVGIAALVGERGEVGDLVICRFGRLMLTLS